MDNIPSPAQRTNKKTSIFLLFKQSRLSTMEIFVSKYNLKLDSDLKVDSHFYRLPYAQETRHYFSREFNIEVFLSIATFGEYKAWLWHIETGTSTDFSIKRCNPEPEIIFTFCPIRLEYSRDSLIFIDSFNPVVRYNPNGVTTFRILQRNTYDLLISSCFKTVLHAFAEKNVILQQFRKAIETKTSCILGPFRSIDLNPRLIGLLIDLFSNPFSAKIRELHLIQVYTIFNILCIDVCHSERVLTRHQQAFYQKWHGTVLALSEKPYLLLHRLSQDLSTNDYGIKTGFRMFYNTNFSVFKQDIKLKKSFQFLLFSQEMVADIAARAGYANLSSFAGPFFKKFQISPNKFRQAIQGNTLTAPLYGNSSLLNDTEDNL